MAATLTRRLYRRYCVLKESLSTCRSPAGALVKYGPVGDDGGRRARQHQHSEDLHFELAHLVYLFEHLLTTDELTVLRTLERPMPHAKRCAFLLGEGKRCDCGALDYYERKVRDGELVLTVACEGELPVQETKRGEPVIGPLRYPKDHERAGEVVEGWSRVGGANPVYPTLEQAANHLGMSKRALVARIEAANRKIEQSFRDEALSEL